MTRSSYPLKLPESIKKDAERLAQADGVSLNQWILAAVAQKIGATQAASLFFQTRAKQYKPGDLARILANVPDNPPIPGDELPEEVVKKIKRTAKK